MLSPSNSGMSVVLSLSPSQQLTWTVLSRWHRRGPLRRPPVGNHIITNLPHYKIDLKTLDGFCTHNIIIVILILMYGFKFCSLCKIR